MLIIIPFVLSAQDSHSHDQQAHEHSGTVILGGAVNYWYDSHYESHSLHIHPEVAYFVNNRVAIGLGLGFGLYKTSTYYNEVYNNYNNHIEFSVSPFVRYFYLYRLPFKLYFDSGIGYSYYNFTEYTQGETHGFEVGVRPGASLDLAEGLCLCMHFGFIGYRKNYIGGDEPGLGSSGFGAQFTPHELSIGLEFEF